MSEQKKKARTLKEARKLVQVVATKENKHHKTGMKITCDEKIAKVLIEKGYATAEKGAK